HPGEVTPFYNYRGVSGRRVAFVGGGGTLLAASDSGTVIELRLDRPARLRTLVAHDGPVLALAVTSAGDRMASASRDGAIRLWSVSTFDTLRTLAGHRGA